MTSQFFAPNPLVFRRIHIKWINGMLLVAYPVLASNLMHSSKAITMNQHSQSASSLAEIMDGKQKRRDALMLAVSLASPFELEGPAQRLKEALQKPDIEHHRQRIPPPAFAR